MREGGREGSDRRAESVRRLMRCRVTERWDTFFDTTTAYPFVFVGITAEKLADERRLPLRADGNAVRESRCLRENTERVKR
ncbi:MAG: hypothetical protein UY89_C0014G0007 [Parcubacteria group bacterium GW2011_GWA1_54_9]|nr:MAG: hypothetical protein UY89_C0014G0007 [Parcubacteria group bacterium GW2011_GWA1_54_9]